MKKRTRLQREAFHRVKDFLEPIGYSRSRNGNICMYYKGGYSHWLNDSEKETVSLEGLPEHYRSKKEGERV